MTADARHAPAPGHESLPLVLLHGFTGSPESWRGVRQVLDSRHPHARIVTPSLPGHHPDHPVAPGFMANIEHLATNIGRALAHPTGGDPRHHRPRPHLVGYSLGARAALALAVYCDLAIGRLTLIGVNPGLTDESARQDRAAADRARATMLRQHGVNRFVDEWQEHPIFASQTRLPPETRAAQRAIRLAHDAHALADSLDHMGLARMPDLHPGFTTLDMPIDVVTGELDEIYTRTGRALAARNPNARLLVVAGCGHNPVLEDPEAVARILASRR